MIHYNSVTLLPIIKMLFNITLWQGVFTYLVYDIYFVVHKLK